MVQDLCVAGQQGSHRSTRHPRHHRRYRQRQHLGCSLQSSSRVRPRPGCSLVSEGVRLQRCCYSSPCNGHSLVQHRARCEAFLVLLCHSFISFAYLQAHKSVIHSTLPSYSEQRNMEEKTRENDRTVNDMGKEGWREYWLEVEGGCLVSHVSFPICHTRLLQCKVRPAPCLLAIEISCISSSTLRQP